MGIIRWQRERKWRHSLPGPLGTRTQTAERGLVHTFCQHDKTVGDDDPQNWGTGFFVGANKDNEPNFVLTSDIHCGWPGQTIVIRQGRNWANARPVKREEGGLALLEVYSPMRFSLYGQMANTLPIRRNGVCPDKAVMVGYHHPWRERKGRLARCSFLRYDEVTINEGGGFAVDYKLGMHGSPIFADGAVMAVALHYDWRNERMAICEHHSLTEFLRGTVPIETKKSVLVEV